MKRKTTEQFIEDAKIAHGDKYDYSLVNYINNKTNVKIICPIHDEFKQRPDDHLKGCGCRKCYNDSKRLKMKEFITKAKLIHGNKYDYSLVKYIDTDTKVKIICPIHGDFEQSPHAHIGKQMQGCKKCHLEKITKTTEEFIKESKLIHENKYDYSIVKYIKGNLPIKIICPIHGEFKQTPDKHISGNGCKKCYVEKITKTIEQFIKESKLIHGDKYDYSLVNYINNKTNVKIICPIHDEFKQRPDDHLNGHGCEKCNDSSGEKTISNYLLKNNILFETQKRFNSCKNKRKLPFDFFIPSKNICIEFDGIQHFKPIKIWGGIQNLKYIQNNDKIKNKFCEDNGIKLIRIKYSENIENKLKKELEI